MKFRSPSLLTFVVTALSILSVAPVPTCADAPLPQLTPDESALWSRAAGVFRKKCVSCHGAEKMEGGLRLDRGRRVLLGGDSGKAVVAGMPTVSELLKRVRSKDEDLRMPPEGAPLTADEIDVLRDWIQGGAKWADAEEQPSDHWAFQPIAINEPPAMHSAWVRNGIDAFVLQRLQQQKVDPSPEASREALIRRVHLDLLGLPPSPAEVDAFLKDTSDTAYESMVSRALDSPHYGERWGRHWLDLARYADSDGYEKDRPRPNAWRYRQWVIDALNANMPFDQFTVEQIAGDMLPDATASSKIATGFHRNTLHNTEGGTDKEEDRVKKTVDRINTVGSIWMGLTVGCAQCHTHKYDAITQREYYQLYGFFNHLDEKDVAAPTPAEAKAYNDAIAKHNVQIAKLETQQREYIANHLAAAQADWEKTASSSPAWEPVEITSLKSRHGAKFEQSDLGEILVTGKNVTADLYTVEFSTTASKTASKPIAALRLEVLPDSRLPKNGPGRAENGNFVLTEVRLEHLDSQGEKATVLPLSGSRADFSQQDWAVEKAINDNRDDGWAVSPQIGKRHVAVFQLKSAKQGSKFRLTLDQNYKGNSHNLGKFRITVSTEPTAPLDGLPAEVAQAIQVAKDQRTTEQQKRLDAHYRTVDPTLAKIRSAITARKAKAPKATSAVAQAVIERGEPRATHVHLRGDFLSPGDVVYREGLEVLPPVVSRRDGERPDRLDFANWLIASDNPLTARVTVNRVWQRYFGRGLVATVDDFGTQGDRPTHPELLDWLAMTFRNGGWNLKELHRTILQSATYRQSSDVRPELIATDPDNEWLARHPRRRVEAEIVRDLALAASGLLNPKLGGPSVRPPQPAEYSKLTYANSAKWTVSKNGDQYRRGLYTFFQRTSPYPMLMTFDSPDSTECTAKRSNSNTPLQALTLWNDAVFFECAQQLAHRILRETPAGGDRAAFAAKVCLTRTDAKLVQLLQSIHGRHLSLCKQADESELKSLAGPGALPDGVSLRDGAAWVLTGRVLLNLDAFIVKP